jgi:molybdenum cofactor biosynthesis protein B
MSCAEHRAQAAGMRLGFAILTVSDTRNASTDRGGPLVAELATAAGHAVVARAIVADEPESIRAGVREFLRQAAVDVVVTTGGTGLAPRDLTPEALTGLFERPLEGFGELFRMLSFAEIGAAAMLSRATAGIIDGRLVFLLPGSPGAVRLAMERLILPEVAHLLMHLRPANPPAAVGTPV